MKVNPKILYRYVDNNCSFFSKNPTLEEWPVVKETRCTWVVEKYMLRKRVLKDAHKQYACLTVKAALTSFITRRKKQIEILQARLDAARVSLAAAEDMATTRLLTYKKK